MCYQEDIIYSSDPMPLRRYSFHLSDLDDPNGDIIVFGVRKSNSVNVLQVGGVQKSFSNKVKLSEDAGIWSRVVISTATQLSLIIYTSILHMLLENIRKSW